MRHAGGSPAKAVAGLSWVNEAISFVVPAFLDLGDLLADLHKWSLLCQSEIWHLLKPSLDTEAHGFPQENSVYHPLQGSEPLVVFQ